MSRNMDRAGQSEARFIVKAFEKGWEIAKPFHHAQSYDFVIRKDEKWQTVQVKSAHEVKDKRRPKGIIYKVVDLRRKGIKFYKEGDFDLLAVVFEECVWFIKWEEISHIKARIVLGHKYDKFII